MVYSETRYVPEKWTTGDSVKAGLVAAAVVGLMVWAAPDFIDRATSAPVVLTSAHVIINTPKGHGSATHIGDGLYVTAAHVVGANAEVSIGDKPGVVLWANAAYDIALISGPDTAASVPLACVTPAVGDVGIAHGNPMFLTNVSTELTVAGEARQIGDWKVAMPMDGAMAPGMSGGSWVVGGRIEGINIGLLLMPTGIGASITGISIVVPASVVCDLLGRT